MERSSPAAVSLLAALALAGCASEPLPAPEGWDRPGVRGLRVLSAEGPLLAGAARAPLDPPFALPMGGYFGGSELLLREQRDPLWARALVLEAGGLRIAIVSVDRVLIPPELRPEVESSAEFRGAGISAWSLLATHCHTAPGAFARAWPAQRFGVGSYDALSFRHLARACAEAVSQAARTLRPVSVQAGEAAPSPGEPPLSYNRKVRGGLADGTVRALALWPAPADGAATAPEPVARLVSFAAHPTMIPASLRRASADFPGVLARALERPGSVALFLQGPSGDIAAGIHREESREWWERRMEWLGGRLDELARKALPGGAPAEGAAAAAGARSPPPAVKLAYAEGEILLPPRRPWRVPFVGRSIARSYPDRVRARAVRVGGLCLVLFPGELGSDLGAAVRADLLAADSTAQLPRAVWVATLADDYLGYAFSRQQYRRGGMSQHLTIYGEGLGDHLRPRLVEIGRAALR